MASRKDRMRRKSLSVEERYKKSVSARRKFKAIVRLIICNLTWLQEIEDEQLGDNVRRNIQVLTRKKGKKSILTLRDKAVLNKPQELRTEAEKNHLRRLIGNLKCFRRYPAEVKHEFPAIMYFNFFGPNRVIVKQDYEPLNMYVIVSGEVVVSQTYYDRLLKETVTKDVLIMGPGNYFGEVSLLHNIARTATVTTTQETEFLYVKREDFDRVLKSTVAKQWGEIQLNMSWFSYFQDWDEIDIRESCILAKKKFFESEEIILSSSVSQDSVFFVTKGKCNLIQMLTIQTTYHKGLPHYTLLEDGPEAPMKMSQEAKKILKKVDSDTGTLKQSTGTPSKKAPTPTSNIRTHFIKVCTFSKLACFNVGEDFKNRIIIAVTQTECLLLPRYFLMDKSMLTFKAIELHLRRHIPTPRQIFQNYLEDKRWTQFKEHLVGDILENTAFTGNTIHNVPYSIRLEEDLPET